MKALKHTYLLALGTAMMWLSSCDKVDNPIEIDNSGVIIDSSIVVTTYTDNSTGRSALIMDFTGHNCQNCPAAAATAEEIQDDYPEDVRIMAVHPDIPGLTPPLPFHPENGFQTNWLTPEGTYLQNTYDIPSSIPQGVVSGLEIGGSYSLGVGDWRGVTEGVIDEALPMSINIDKGYSEVTRTVTFDASIEFNQDFSENLAIVFALLESGMVDWQLNGTEAFPANPEYPGGEVEDYVHKHVLRKHLNGNQGTDITSAPVSSGDVVSLEYATTVSEDYIAENCELIAYVYDRATLEIYHSIEMHLID